MEQPTARPHGENWQKKPWLKDRVLLLTVPVVLALDQFTKFLIRENLALGESWPAEGLVRITHGLNTGAVFGLFPAQTTFLIVASLVAIGFLVYFYRAHAMPRRVLRLAIGLQLGGALGNLFDRLKDGAVVDFIDIGWWPIFNVADSSVVIGMTILIATLLLADIEPASKAEASTGSSEGPNEGDGAG